MEIVNHYNKKISARLNFNINEHKVCVSTYKDKNKPTITVFVGTSPTYSASSVLDAVEWCVDYDSNHSPVGHCNM